MDREARRSRVTAVVALIGAACGTGEISGSGAGGAHATTATVGAGAEVMADGCVHIYGALRGRAMAGVRGDATARVFCQEFRAELVAIAGVFRVFETLPAELAGQPVQAWLDGEELRFTRIGA